MRRQSTSSLSGFGEAAHPRVRCHRPPPRPTHPRLRCHRVPPSHQTPPPSLQATKAARRCRALEIREIRDARIRVQGGQHARQVCLFRLGCHIPGPADMAKDLSEDCKYGQGLVPMPTSMAETGTARSREGFEAFRGSLKTFEGV
eukprot:358836-Chlamydomonas_euryale.AAC.1